MPLVPDEILQTSELSEVHPVVSQEVIPTRLAGDNTAEAREVSMRLVMSPEACGWFVTWFVTRSVVFAVHKNDPSHRTS